MANNFTIADEILLKLKTLYNIILIIVCALSLMLIKWLDTNKNWAKSWK